MALWMGALSMGKTLMAHRETAVWSLVDNLWMRMITTPGIDLDELVFFNRKLTAIGSDENLQQ